MPLPSRRGDELDGFRPLAEINVTPLVDVMLVLLIVFMVTAPMMIAGLNINLPKAAAARPLTPKEPLLVTVTRDNRYLLGSEELKAEDIVGAVRARLDGDASRAIYIQGDRETIYGNIIRIVDGLAAAGFGKIVMVTDRKRSVAPGEAP